MDGVVGTLLHYTAVAVEKRGVGFVWTMERHDGDRDPGRFGGEVVLLMTWVQCVSIQNESTNATTVAHEKADG